MCMWWMGLASAALTVPSVTHAAISRDAMRSIMYRWKTSPIVIEDHIMFRDRDASQRYVRASIACADSDAFGVLQYEDSWGLVLFVMQIKSDCHVLRVMLPSAQTDRLVDSTKQLLVWHSSTFEETSLVASDPPERALLRRARYAM